MQYDLFNPIPKYKLISLSSGSNGNCYYLGTSQYGILIDAGIGIRTIRKYLREHSVALETIIAVLVTHNHADHIKAIGGLGQKMKIPVYATEAIHFGINRSRFVQDTISIKRIVEKEETFKIKDFQITAFDIPHDSIENVGYEIRLPNGKTIVLATDIGRITDTIIRYTRKANHLIVEANYDEEMLRNGRYPEDLKRRITSGMGHLSNRLTGELLSEVYHDALNDIWLCHLSQDNNTPEMARKTVEDALKSKGLSSEKDFKLKILSRGKPSSIKEF